MRSATSSLCLCLCADICVRNAFAMPSTIQRRAWHMHRHTIESTRTLMQWQQTLAGKNYIFFLDTCIQIAAFDTCRYLRAEYPRHAVYNTEEDMHTRHDSIIHQHQHTYKHHQKQQLITESCSHLHSSACRLANRTQAMQTKSHPRLDKNSCIPLSMVCHATTFATPMLLDTCSSRQMFP